MNNNEIIEFIDKNIESAIGCECIINDKYHHNCGYKNSSSIIKHGILSINDLNKLGITEYSDEILKVLDDRESHINGIQGVSLSVVGLNDLYKDEVEYDPFNPKCVDFIVDSNVKAGRVSENYGNEFVCSSSITRDKIRAVDVRLRKFLKLIKDKDDIESAIKYYKYLQLLALTIKEEGVNIPLREMSYGDRCLDIEKVIKLPKIK